MMTLYVTTVGATSRSAISLSSPSVVEAGKPARSQASMAEV